MAVRFIRRKPSGPRGPLVRIFLVSVVLFLGLVALTVSSCAILSLFNLWQGDYHILSNSIIPLIASEIPMGVLLLLLAIREVT